MSTRKPSAETIRKRIATRKRNAAKRRRIMLATARGERRPELAARARLEIDGCTGSAATRRRVLWVVHERKLAPAEIEKAMTCKAQYLGEFAERYQLSFDWLLFGDLNGLQRMTQPKPKPALLTATQLLKLYDMLTVNQKKSLAIAVAGRAPKSPLSQIAYMMRLRRSPFDAHLQVPRPFPQRGRGFSFGARGFGPAPVDRLTYALSVCERRHTAEARISL
jgi:hypothetical protein